MVRRLLDWMFLTFAISLASYFLPFINISGDDIWDIFKIAFIAGLLLGLINMAIRPIFRIVSLPFNLITMGIFNVMLNAGILWIVDTIIKDLKVEGFWGYVGGSIVIGFINAIVARIVFFRRKKD